MLALASAALLCLSSVAPVAVAPTGGPRFGIPAGWLDLSPGAPEESFASLPLTLAADARKYAALAIDLDGARNGFASNLNASIEPGLLRVTESSLDSAAGDAMSEIKKQLPSASLRERAVERIDGARCLRLVYDSEQGGQPLRHLAYEMPVGERTAFLTFTARRDAFDGYLERFEKAASATTGLQEAPALVLDGRRILLIAIIGGILGGLVAFGYRCTKRQS
jgi:hypothetical protein